MPLTHAPTHDGIDYTPDGSGNAFQRLWSFVAPANGNVVHPVLIVIGRPDLADFDSAVQYPPTADTAGRLASVDGLPWRMRAAGWTVVWANVTLTDAAVVPNGGTFDAATPTGAHAERDVAHVVQWVRDNAADLNADPARVFLYADGHAPATAAAQAAVSPDFADPGGATSQEQQSSRVKGAALLGALTHWPALDQTSDAPHFTLPTAALSTVAGAVQEAASALAVVEANAGLNDALAVFLGHLEPDESPDDHSSAVADAIAATGSAWFGHALLAALQDDALAFHQVHSEVFDGAAQGATAAELATAAHLWLAREASQEPAEERVLRELQALLAGITHANGYATDLAGVYRSETFPKGASLPAAVLFRLPSRNDDQTQGPENDQVSLNIAIAVEIEDVHMAQLRLAQAIADVRKRIQRADQLPDATGQDTLVDKLVVRDWERHLPTADDDDNPWAALVVEVQFTDRYGDPYQLTPHP